MTDLPSLSYLSLQHRGFDDGEYLVEHINPTSFRRPETRKQVSTCSTLLGKTGKSFCLHHLSSRLLQVSLFLLRESRVVRARRVQDE